MSLESGGTPSARRDRGLLIDAQGLQRLYDQLTEARTGRWSWFLLILAILPATLPLLKGSFLSTHDGFSHLFRIAELDAAISSGLVYPRWAPELAMGYGYPVLNFYAPLTYYLTEFFHTVGVGLINSFNLTLAVGLVASGVGMFLFAYEVFGRRSVALLSAVAYVYTPYQFVDVYVRGAFGEVFTFVFLPLLFLSISRVISVVVLVSFKDPGEVEGGARPLPIRLRTILASPALQRFGRAVMNRYFLLGALSTAGLVLSHNVMALLAMPLVGFYTLWRVYRGSLYRNRFAVLQLIGAMILFGFGLAAFYWLPALQERQFTKVDVLLDAFFGGVGNQLFSPLGLVQGSLFYNYDFHWQSNPFKLGLIQALLALLGIFAIRVKRIKRDILFMLLALLGLLFMMTTASSLVWQNVPLISFVEFPWRLLAFVGFFTALLAGAVGVLIIEHPKVRGNFWSVVPICGLGLIIMASSLVSLSPVYAGIAEEEIGRQTAARFDFDEGAVGTNKAGEYLPLWVGEKPLDIPRGILVSEGTSAGAVPDITIQEWSPYKILLATNSMSQSDIKLHAFYFPGWVVDLDELDAVSLVSSSLGLVGVRVPAGGHSVMFRFEDTLARQAGNFLSIICFSYLVLLWWRAKEKGFGLSLIVLATISMILATGIAKPALAARPEAVTSVKADFGGKMNLIGWRREKGVAMAAGGKNERAVPLTLFWQTRERMIQDYLVSLSLIGTDGKVWGQSTKAPMYGGTQTSKWQPGELMADLQSISLNPDAPAGEYSLWLSLVPNESGNPLRVMNTAFGQVAGGTDLKIGTIRMEQGPAAERAQEADQKTNLVLEKGIAIDGFSLRSGQQVSSLAKGYLVSTRPGELLAMRLFAHTSASLNEDYTFSLVLQDLEGKLLADKAFVPVSEVFPTSLWNPEQRRYEDINFELPANLTPGGYSLLLEVYNGFDGKRLKDSATGVERLPLTTIKVPKTRTAMSSSQNAIASWRDKVSITAATWVAGGKNFNVTSGLVVPIVRGDTLRLKLQWRADTGVGEDFTTFVHLIDGLGQVKAQIDRPPGNKNYPSSIWEADEIIDEEYDLPVPDNLPPGRYRILVGLYSPGESGRWAVSNSSLAVENEALLLSETEMR